MFPQTWTPPVSPVKRGEKPGRASPLPIARVSASIGQPVFLEGTGGTPALLTLPWLDTTERAIRLASALASGTGAVISIFAMCVISVEHDFGLCRHMAL